MTQSVVVQIEAKLRMVEALPRMVSRHLESKPVTDELLLPLMHELVAGAPD